MDGTDELDKHMSFRTRSFVNRLKRQKNNEALTVGKGSRKRGSLHLDSTLYRGKIYQLFDSRVQNETFFILWVRPPKKAPFSLFLTV